MKINRLFHICLALLSGTFSAPAQFLKQVELYHWVDFPVEAPGAAVGIAKWDVESSCLWKHEDGAWPQKDMDSDDDVLVEIPRWANRGVAAIYGRLINSKGGGHHFDSLITASGKDQFLLLWRTEILPGLPSTWFSIAPGVWSMIQSIGPKFLRVS